MLGGEAEATQELGVEGHDVFEDLFPGFLDGLPDGVTVPGQVTATGRVSAGKRQRFSLHTKRYVLAGWISGALVTPKVTGTLKVLSGGCGGETLPFTAKLAG